MAGRPRRREAVVDEPRSKHPDRAKAAHSVRAMRADLAGEMIIRMGLKLGEVRRMRCLTFDDGEGKAVPCPTCLLTDMPAAG
jgi:hypothetical protein